jgi:iron complex outermembrane receptor protein
MGTITARGTALVTLTLVAASAQVLAGENGNAAAQTNSAANADKDAPQSWAGDTVIVTGKRDGYVVPEGGSATRTNTPLIEVPQSVQVLTSSLIADQDRRTLADALVNVSGVTPTKPEESAIAQPLVRGFPAEIYLDGLPAFGVNALADPTSLTGVERIEVVKGPTSTVYGGGAGAPLGGLINVVSVRPKSDEGGYVAFRAGSFSTVNPYADFNMPFGDKVAARITGEYQRNDSWIDQVKGERWSIQPSVSFQLDDQTELLVRGKYDRRVQLEYSGLPADQAVAGQLARYAFPGAPIGQPRSTIVNKLITPELRHSFSDTLQLTVTGRYYYNRYEEYGSFVYPSFIGADPATPTVYPIFPIYLPATVKEATVDANLLAKLQVLGGSHELLVGANYDHTNYDTGISFDFTPVGLLDLAHPTYNLAFGPTLPVLSTQTDTYKTIAVYVQDQATYGRLHLSGSLRYTQFNFQRQETELDATYRRVNPRIGATFDLVPGAALFVGYATGFRGAIQFTALPGQVVKPETSRSVEGGLKLALTEAHVWGTLAAFELTRRNVSTVDPDNPLFSIQTGEQRSRGFETDITWEPIRALSILANYAYTKAEVAQDNVIPVGEKLPRVPKQSGRIAAHYRVLNGPAAGLSFGAGITAFSSREDFLPNTVSVPGYAAVDAQASYDYDRYTVTVSGVNLAGRRAFDTYEYLSPVVIPTQPRSAYLMLKARF